MKAIVLGLSIILLYSCESNSYGKVTSIEAGNVVKLNNRFEVTLAGISNTTASKNYLLKNVLNQQVKYVMDLQKSSRKKKIVYLTTKEHGSVNRQILLAGHSSLIEETCQDSLNRYKTIADKEKSRINTTNIRVATVSDKKKVIKDLPSLIDDIKDNVFLIYQYDEDGKVSGSGTGFFIDDNGTAVSNYHVFEGGSGFGVKLDSEKIYEISDLVAYNEESDYIIFKVNLEGRLRKGMAGALKKPRIGQEIYVLGNPRGLETTLSKGIISSLRSGSNLIQIDAAISPGSSGSPVFNSQGEVIGIATLKLMDCENCNFAVDFKLIQNELKQLAR